MSYDNNTKPYLGLRNGLSETRDRRTIYGTVKKNPKSLSVTL